MSYYDRFDTEPVERPAPRYDPDLGSYTYGGVYAEGQREIPFAARMQAKIKQFQALKEAQRIQQANPAGEAERLVAEQRGQQRKGLGKLLAIPEAPGVRHALEFAGRLGQANLVGGLAGRTALRGETLVVQDRFGNKVTLKPGESLADRGLAVHEGGTTRDVSARGASVNPLRVVSEAAKGYGRGVTGHEKTSVVEATGGTVAGFKLPEKGGGRIATEILGGTVSDPLSFLGAGRAATAFKSVKGAAAAARGGEVASQLGRVGLKNLDEADRLAILGQLEQTAAAAPGRLARGTAAQRAAKTFGRAEKFGAEGLHVNIPFVPGASGQFSLGGGRFAQAASGVDEALGVGKAFEAFKGAGAVTKARSLVNPRARIAAQLGDETATAVQDAERRAGATRMIRAEDADEITTNLLKERPYSKEDYGFIQRALDEGTDVNEMARARPDLAPMILHLNDLVQQGDEMLLDLGVKAEHLHEAGSYFPRTLTKEGRTALEGMNPDQLQRLFGSSDVNQIRADIEKGTVLHRRTIRGNLSEAEAVARKISGKENVKFFEDDPVKAILAHYKDIAGAHSQRGMLRELSEAGVIKAAKSGKEANIDAGDFGGRFEGPQALADYFGRRTPQKVDPALQDLSKLRSSAETGWKAFALNWPGTAMRDIFGNAWQQMIHGAGGVRSRRSAGGAQGAIDFARRNPLALAAEDAPLPPPGQMGFDLGAVEGAAPAAAAAAETPEQVLQRFREMGQTAPQAPERPLQPVLPGASGRARGIPVQGGVGPEARNAQLADLLDQFKRMNAPQAAPDEALDALKEGGGLTRGSRVDETLRAIAEGRLTPEGVQAADAELALLARAQGANLPGFTKSLRGTEGVRRTRAGRAAETVPTALRKLVGSERYEERARLSLFQKLVSEGMDPNLAARRVEDVFFNYADVSEPVRKARGLSPFVGFQVKNVQRTLRDLGEAPGRVTYPARAQTAAMTEQEASGEPSLLSKMAGGAVPIPGTDIYAQLPITSDAALEQLFLAPRLASVLTGAKADENLARDITKQIGGPLPGLGKALVETQTGESLFTGGKLKPGVMNNPFVTNLIPSAGRVSSLGPVVGGEQAPEEAVFRHLLGIPVSRGDDPRLQQSEVYRAESASPVNDAVDRMFDQLDIAERQGQDEKADAIRAVIEWLKANPGYVDTSVAPASQDPALENPLAKLREFRNMSFAERMLEGIKNRSRPPESLRQR